MPEHRVAHYQILDKIGEGGMGVVYKAEDTHLQRTVAIKFLPAGLTRDPVAKQRFIHEAQSASALDHPNIGTVYEFNETEDGQLYMVMAYYDGDPLAKRIEQGPLPLADAVGIASQVAEGLARAHARGIVHRDIKDINLIITRDGLVKILDFGVAKLIGHGDKPAPANEPVGLSTGTIGYMSPEQISGETVDDRTDIWSLGIVLYQMITGELPFQGEYAQAVCYSILNEQPKPLRIFRKDIPPELEEIVRKSLIKNPQQRYRHVLEMAEELKEVRQKLQSESPEGIPARGRVKTRIKLYRYGFITIPVLLLLVYLWFSRLPVQKITDRSITIIPFKNLSAEGYEDYFSDGITEDILIRISKIRDLKVISFYSSKSYKGSDKSLPEIGRELKVRHLLQGTVRRMTEQIRLTVQLIDLQTDEVLWAETYDRKLVDVFRVQDEIAANVAARLTSGTTYSRELILPARVPQEKKIIGSTAINLGAYDYYLKGREYYYRYRNEDNESAVQLFKKALTLENGYALAHAGLADAYVQRTLRYGMQPDWLDSAMNQCQQALACDENSAEAYKALGLVYYTRSWFQKSLTANLAAVRLNPNYDPALGNIGWIYYNLGRFDEAFHWLQQAIQLNPLNPNLNLGMGMVCFALQRYVPARKYLETALTLQPMHRPNALIGLTMIDLIRNDLQAAAGERSRANLQNQDDAILLLVAGDAALQSGNPGLAGEYYQKVMTIEQQVWQPFTGIAVTTNLGFLFWKTAHFDRAEVLFDLSLQMDRETMKQGSEWWGLWYDMAAVQAIKGDTTEALNHLDHAHKLGFNLPAWLQIDPLFENLREQDRFKELITNMAAAVDTMDQGVPPIE
jgi:serine/threonine protein kinase/Tfp pilus assembly protein PilF